LVKPSDESPVTRAIEELDKGSAVAAFGHPLHAMLVHFPIAFVAATLVADMLYWHEGDPFWVRVGLWAAGAAFWSGLAASLVGTAELLLVKGIRVRATSWKHAVAAMTLLAAMGMNWGLRLTDPDAILPHGLALSALCGALAGLAGWHGGKLVFDHGIAIRIDPER
jgi:uncharacterized membrane protein